MTQNELVQAIHNSPTKASLIITGGGTGVLPILLANGNGSKTIIGAEVPYSNAHLKDIIGHFDKAVSKETSMAMAKKAYDNAIRYGADVLDAVGIGLTASLAKVPTEREGRIHEVYITAKSAFKETTIHVIFNADGNPSYRPLEEMYCSDLVLHLLSRYSGVEEYIILPSDTLTITEEVTNRSYIQAFPTTDGFVPLVDVKFKTNLIFPGSFNPVHEGHKEMANIASEIYKETPMLEISIENVDKGRMTKEQISERLSKIHASKYLNVVALTEAPTFVDKARLFPGATFIIGYDTAVRIIDPKYAGPVEDVLKCFEENNTHFIMFPRIVGGKLQSDLSVFPERFLKMVTVYDKERKYTHLASRDLRSK